MLISGERFRAQLEALLVFTATGLYAAGLCFVAPTVFESADFLLYFKPVFHFLAESVRAGTLPLWNPYAGLGRPFLADTQNAVCYPPTYLICFGQEFGVFLQVWLHGAWAIFGMRRLGGALGTGRWQSYLMGFSFLLSGELIARWVSGQIAYCWALSFVPWLLYHAVRTREPWQGWRLAQYAGCLALQFLCGHPQVFWFSAIGQAAFIVSSTLRLPLREGLRDLVHCLGQFGVASVWCTALVAVTLLPMLELAHESNRAQSTAAFANSYNMRWSDLRYLFAPRWKGLVWESNLLVGAIVVFTGAMGLCRVRERNVRGLLGMLGIGLLLALGDNTPLFGLFYKWLPGYAGFRFQARAALLAVVALICAEGIWLSRPHPRLRQAWDYLLGIPVRYVLALLVVVQVLDLLQGAWMTKRFVTPTCCLVLGVPFEHSLERTLLPKAFREQDLIRPSLPPPRVCVPPSVIPANYGMIYHYAGIDAAGSLFLRRPWDYLHGMVGVTPPIEKGSLALQVYDQGPFPYRDLSLSVGKLPKEQSLSVKRTPSPRAIVTYAAQSADYGTVLNLLTNGHDIQQCALVETPLAEPLPRNNGLVADPAVIRRFEPNELLVDVEARTNALLVLAEAWYPGWKAEVDGQPAACVPANAWMRGVPTAAGRHEIRLYFRQNFLLAGFLISLVSLGLLVAMAKRGRVTSSPVGEPVVTGVPPQPRAAGKYPSQRVKSLARGQENSSRPRPFLRVLAFDTLLALAGLLAYAEIQHLRIFQGKKAGADANVEISIGDALVKQRRAETARPHFIEAVRLAEQACRLTKYTDPGQFFLLALAYHGAGSLDRAFDTAKLGRNLALAGGQNSMAVTFQEQMNNVDVARKAQAGQRK